MSDFLSTYLRYTRQQESPTEFHTWVALAIISATMRRRTFLDRDFMKLYPNIYVLIVGPPGQQKKSTAVNIGMGLLQEAQVGVQIYSERMTGEGVMLSMNRMVANTATNTITTESDLMIVAPEFISMFGADQSQAGRMIAYMTRWYDCPDIFPYNTGAHGKIELLNMYPVLLCASSKQLLSVIPKEAEGGFLSRVIFVHSNERKRIPRPKKTTDGPELVRILQEVSKMQGPFALTQPAWDFFDDWYMTVPDSADPRVAGFMERMPDHVLKTACLMAAGRGKMTIDLHVLDAAIGLVRAMIPGVTQALSYVGTTDFSQLTDRILDQLRTTGPTTKIHLYNANSFMASVADVDTAVGDLIARQVVRESWHGTVPVYELIATP